MKKKLVILIAILFAGGVMVNAQGGGPRRTVEERVKAATDKLADFNLDQSKKTLTDSAFTQYYRAQDVKRQEMMSQGGTPDREKMREEMKKFGEERDEKLKKIFTDDQFKKWKDEIEPSLRPQKPGGNGGNQ